MGPSLSRRRVCLAEPSQFAGSTSPCSKANRGTDASLASAGRTGQAWGSPRLLPGPGGFGWIIFLHLSGIWADFNAANIRAPKGSRYVALMKARAITAPNAF